DQEIGGDVEAHRGPLNGTHHGRRFEHYPTAVGAEIEDVSRHQIVMPVGEVLWIAAGVVGAVEFVFQNRGARNPNIAALHFVPSTETKIGDEFVVDIVV